MILEKIKHLQFQNIFGMALAIWKMEEYNDTVVVVFFFTKRTR
jgi:hypothetical protein